MKNGKVIRDFVYLDWERVRSITAQLLQGLPEESTTEKGKEIKTTGEIGGAIPQLVSVKGGADYRYFSTGNETRSFHHYIYTLMEDNLLSEDMVTIIGEDFDFSSWTLENFEDGQFILVEGLIRIMDYSWIAKNLEAFPGIMKTGIKFQEMSLKEKLKTQEVSQQDYQNQLNTNKKTMQDLKSYKIDEVTNLIRELYGDTFRIKVMPNKDFSGKIFVGSGNPANLHDTPAELSQKYGYEVDANWVALGQVNLSEQSQDPIPMPIGNQMEDSFEGLALIMNNIFKSLGAPTFPAISFTPISLYRKVLG